MWIRKKFRFEEAAQICGIDVRVMTEWIENQWIVPAEPDERVLDDEDIARMHLIQNLRSDFDVNDEAIPIILHLLDQLHHLHHRIRDREPPGNET